MIHYGIEQGSPEWHALRVGKVTASRFKDVLAKSKKDGLPLKARDDYMFELMVERITGVQNPGGTFKQTEWGKANETHARIEYCQLKGIEPEQISFFEHGLYECGASPDGITADGGYEIKCPYDSANHVLTLLNGMPDAHEAQVQGSMWITGAKYWDFISFDPRMPDRMRLYVQRIKRDESYIRSLENEVLKFLEELDAKVDHLLSKFTPKE